MSLVKRHFLTITVVASFLILATLCATQKHYLTAAYASRIQRGPNAGAQEVPGRDTKPILGIEVSQRKPFFMQAATASQRLASAIIRVSSADGKGPKHDSVSAIKLEPRVEKDKVRVNVFVLYGDTQGLKKCQDLDALKTVKVGSYVAGPDKEVLVTKLRNYGVKMEKDPFTFRVVSRSIFAPVVDLDIGAGSCPCVQCETATCCPNAGYCAQCECVTVCCKGGS